MKKHFCSEVQPQQSKTARHKVFIKAQRGEDTEVYKETH